MLTASLLTSLALKSLVLASVTLALVKLARSRTPAERSLIAHLGLLAILLLPAATVMLPEWAPLPEKLLVQEETAPAVQASLGSAPQVAEPSETVAAGDASRAARSYTPLPAEELAVWVYGIPLALMFAMMALAVLRLFGMRSRAEVLVDGAWLSALAGAQRRMGFKHGTALLVSEELRSPISWGVLRPTILLDPRAVTAVSDAEAIIAHELAHVARLDWAKLLIARLACALFWFNPLVWLLARESHQLREEAADDTVLLTDIAGSDYATLLVKAARHDNNAVLIAAHGVAPAKNSLRRRVVRVLDTGVRRGPVRRGWGMLSLAGALTIAAPLAAFTTVATPAADDAPPASSAPQRLADSGTADRPKQRTPLSADDLIGMRAVGVQPADVAPFRNARGEVDADAVIAAKATGMTPDYVSNMRSVFAGADPDELIGARAVGVDAAYAQAMRAADSDADLDTIISARAVGVTPAYVEEMRRYFPRATLDDLVSMRAIGVTARDVDMMRASGMDAATPDDVAGAKAVMSRPETPRGPPGARATMGGATAVVGPEGAYASRRSADGTVRSASTGPLPVPDSDDD